jgi:hypothetical protein
LVRTGEGLSFRNSDEVEITALGRILVEESRRVDT